MRIKHQEGFTLIELIIVIIVLGLLAAVAMPKFSDIGDEAQDAAEKGVMGGLISAVHIAHGDWLVHSQPNTIVLEGSTVFMSTQGWPESTSNNNGVMTSAKCLELFNGILAGPPEAGAGVCVGDCEILVSGAANQCTYDFEQGSSGATRLTYTITTGNISKGTVP